MAFARADGSLAGGDGGSSRLSWSHLPGGCGVHHFKYAPSCDAIVLHALLALYGHLDLMRERLFRDAVV